MLGYLGNDTVPAGTVTDTPGAGMPDYATFFAPVVQYHAGTRPGATETEQRAGTTREIWTDVTESSTLWNVGAGAVGLVLGLLTMKFVFGGKK